MQQDWEAAYASAMLETDHKQLAVKIDSAQGILQSCLARLDRTPEYAQQRQRIEDALRTLDTVRRIELQIPA